MLVNNLNDLTTFGLSEGIRYRLLKTDTKEQAEKEIKSYIANEKLAKERKLEKKRIAKLKWVIVSYYDESGKELDE